MNLNENKKTENKKINSVFKTNNIMNLVIEERHLNKKTRELLFELEQNTKIPAAKIAANLITGKDKLDNLKTLNRVLKYEKKHPNQRSYSYEEGKKFLGL
jgi:hypothetical protein